MATDGRISSRHPDVNAFPDLFQYLSLTSSSWNEGKKNVIADISFTRRQIFFFIIKLAIILSFLSFNYESRDKKRKGKFIEIISH
jgi:hypothetical protein